jgi:transposase-like protein
MVNNRNIKIMEETMSTAYKMHSAEEKARIVIEALEGEKTMSEIGAREGISAKQISNWKREFIDNAYRAFSVTKDERAAQALVETAKSREQDLLTKIGQLTCELDFAKKKSDEIVSRRKRQSY